MALIYADLDADLRIVMGAELDGYPTYQSPQLRAGRQEDWEQILRTAIAEQSDDWLAQQLLMLDFLSDFSRPDKNGRVSRINKPSAATMLAEGQFNSYYVRAVCLRAIQIGDNDVLVYRAKQSGIPRSRSLEIEGTQVNASALLEALRSHDFVALDAAFGMPLPNSGLSVRIN